MFLTTLQARVLEVLAWVSRSGELIRRAIRLQPDATTKKALLLQLPLPNRAPEEARVWARRASIGQGAIALAMFVLPQHARALQNMCVSKLLRVGEGSSLGVAQFQYESYDLTFR